MAIADLCMHGLATSGLKRVPTRAQKATGSTTNSRSIGKDFCKRFAKGHVHQRLVNGKAKRAASYPPELC